MRHVPTRATVVRAGKFTTLVSLDHWYDGQILAKADTGTIVEAVGIPRHRLPDTRLWVMARLAARTADELDLRGWEAYEPTRARTARIA
ncbi:hypothetical protein [Streptomyces sp. NPDC051636]|uniref:hypothetical protein n=1 Tax=Streptomyces sp. NPDC051636 TaxID=3365663 RepID=UPI0037B8D06A